MGGHPRSTRCGPLRERYGRPQAELEESSAAAALEAVVDVHTFDPDALARLCLRAGAVDVRTVTEELTASWFGWPVRTFEAAVRPGALGLDLGDVRLQGLAAALGAGREVLEQVVPDELLQRLRDGHEAVGTEP